MSNRPTPDNAPATGNARVPEAADTRALVGLLENLVPLLLHFQTQTLSHGAPNHLSGPHGAQLDQQAAVAFTEDIILDSLRNLTGYLQTNGARYPGLDTYASVVSRARQALDVRDYQAALHLILDTYRAVAVLRSIRPELPPVRQRDASEQPAASNASVH